MTEILKLKQLTAADLNRVADSLAGGGLACLPADTVYGLACLPGAPGGLERIYQVKGRDRGKPIALVFAGVTVIFDRVASLPGRLRNAMVSLMPGAITVIIPAEAAEKQALGLPLNENEGVGVRVIGPPLDKLYRFLPGPLAVTSANLSGGPDPISIEEMPDQVRDACDFIIDGGPTPLGVPSSVVDLRALDDGGEPVILRQGPMSRAEIERRIAGCGCC
ncbi:MAG: L-threonylcarbamoyladenylate synthase [Thermoleophilia bacterium]